MNFDLLYKNIKIIIERINEILAYEKEVLYDDSKIINHIEGDIKIKNLYYSYGNRKNLFTSSYSKHLTLL